MMPSINAEEILDELKERRKNIILALYRHGELGAGELRSITGTPRGSKEHHYETLQQWRLMERVGEQRERGGSPERVFALTDDGTAFVGEYLVDTDEAPDAYYKKEVHHGRLYPNLDTLVNMGLVKKGQQDNRTNAYKLTKRAHREIKARREWENEYVSLNA